MLFLLARGERLLRHRDDPFPVQDQVEDDAGEHRDAAPLVQQLPHAIVHTKNGGRGAGRKVDPVEWHQEGQRADGRDQEGGADDDIYVIVPFCLIHIFSTFV